MPLGFALFGVLIAAACDSGGGQLLPPGSVDYARPDSGAPAHQDAGDGTDGTRDAEADAMSAPPASGEVEVTASIKTTCGNFLVWVAPLQTAVGHKITLLAGSDEGVEYRWSLRKGQDVARIASASSPSTELLCVAAGSDVVQLRVASLECRDTASVAIRCTPAETD